MPNMPYQITPASELWASWEPGRPIKYPFADLKVGEQFIVPFSEAKRGTLTSSKKYWEKKLGWQFVIHAHKGLGIHGHYVRRVA